uniref:Uncharacterized protein n=1 Tax=Arundo donax TaxID=35708 RepID=A0A0A8ZIR3_ARUDO
MCLLIPSRKHNPISNMGYISLPLSTNSLAPALHW